mmetsp:Transcript_41218/g.56168  ORF Transcript_41218/g.56168 Transcript_41218/m.56168 type:complete len:281 (+) Transcript_41218:767-1609(+)
MERERHDHLLVVFIVEVDGRHFLHGLGIDDPEVRGSFSRSVDPSGHQGSCVLLVAVRVGDEARISCGKVIVQGEDLHLLSADVKLDPGGRGVVVGPSGEGSVQSVYYAVLLAGVFGVCQGEVKGELLAVQKAGDDGLLGVLSVSLQDEAVVPRGHEGFLVRVPGVLVQKDGALKDGSLKNRGVLKGAQVQNDASVVLLVGVRVVKGEELRRLGRHLDLAVVQPDHQDRRRVKRVIPREARTYALPVLLHAAHDAALREVAVVQEDDGVVRGDRNAVHVVD